MLKKKTIFQKIDQFLRRHGHEKVFSLYLDNYNGNYIYVRFDYVKKVSAYKVLWFDLQFIDIRHLDDYLNIQLVTNVLADKIVAILDCIQYESSYMLNDKIMGDRVEIVSYQKGEPIEFVFSRFLPSSLKELVDPIAILFTYLPRSMECFLNEIFGILDGVEERYNALKPISFDIMHGNIASLFRKEMVKKGESLFAEERISFIEKLNNKYIAIIEDEKTSLIIIELIDEEHVLLWCNCEEVVYCEHIYAVLLAIRKKIKKAFYKVKYIGKEQSLLDKITDGMFSLCFSVEGENLFLISNDGEIIKAPFLKDGKIVFEVLEDDDDLNLSHYIKNYEKE